MKVERSHLSIRISTNQIDCFRCLLLYDIDNDPTTKTAIKQC